MPRSQASRKTWIVSGSWVSQRIHDDGEQNGGGEDVYGPTIIDRVEP
jgi:hypothetical protein